MDDPTKATLDRTFRTPPRILIPKLVRSRDQWKAKAATRKRQYRQEKIRNRDLSLSRQRWKERAEAAAQKLQDLQEQLEAAQADLTQARSQLASLQDDAKKN